jgi:hypothetical protein
MGGKRNRWFKTRGGSFRTLPGDDSREKEGGTRVTDPEQPSMEPLPQINGFPTILDNTIAEQKAISGKIWY